jgi:hypothetical protein
MKIVDVGAACGGVGHLFEADDVRKAGFEERSPPADAAEWKLETREGIESLLKVDLALTKERFEDMQEHRLFAMIFASKNPATGEPFPRVTLLPVLAASTADDREIAGFATFVTEVVKKTAACGVSLVMEAWALQGITLEERKRAPKRFSDDPRSVEVVMYTIEHLRLPAPREFVARIQRDALGRATLAPWVETEFVHREGRFTKLFDRTRFA